jgi:DNA-binding transcriptional LysR family regulator
MRCVTTRVDGIDAGERGRLNLVRHLELFVAVAEERHFGRAAARLGMAQPPVSQAIRRLETTLDVVLFDRGRHGAVLTVAGRDLLPRARALLAEADGLRAAAERHARAGRRVQLGVDPDLGARTTAGAAATTARGGPRVEVTVASSVRLLDALAGDLLDLAVVVHPIPLEGLVAGPVTRLPTELLIPAGHRAARGDGPVSLRALSDLECVTAPRSAGPAAFDLFRETIEVRGCTSRVVTVAEASARVALVASGQAFTLTADPDLAADGVTRRRPAGDPLPLRVRVVHRPDHAEASAIAAALGAVFGTADGGHAG